MVNFLVVHASSAYNVILGRPSLNLFQAMVLTYHMKLKFPVGDEVGELAGDQACSRKYYVETVKRVAHSSPKAENKGEDTTGKKMKRVEAIEESPEFQIRSEEELMLV